jgi:hypothetical protein
MACAHKIGPARRFLAGLLASRRVEIKLPNCGGEVVVEMPVWWLYFARPKVTVRSFGSAPRSISDLPDDFTLLEAADLAIRNAGGGSNG